MLGNETTVQQFEATATADGESVDVTLHVAMIVHIVRETEITHGRQLGAGNGSVTNVIPCYHVVPYVT